MASLALDTPGILFGAYICCVGTVASFVLKATSHDSKLNRIQSVYLVLAAVSSLHILFCEDLLVHVHLAITLHFLMKPFRGLTIPRYIYP